MLLVGSSRKTVTRILANYAVRMRETPILVDVDIGSGSVLMPGLLAAHTLTKPWSLEEGLAADSQPDLAFFYGHLNPKDGPKLFRKQCSLLSDSIHARLAAIGKDSGTYKQHSGFFVIAPSEAEEALVEELCSIFSINVCLVIGNERLYSSLQPKFAFSCVKLPQSGGVVSKDTAYRKYSHSRQFRNYFYGTRGELTPFSYSLPTDSLRVFRVGQEATMAPSSALPLGATRRVDESKAVRVETFDQASLLYSVVAVCHSATSDSDDPLEGCIAGLLHVTAVDQPPATASQQQQFITVLSPCSGPLPSNDLLLGQVRWIDSSVSSSSAR